VVGSPFNHAHLFDTAIKDGKLDLAWRSAVAMEAVSLDRALALTLLLGSNGDERYPDAAGRFLVRFIDEAGADLRQVSKIADALDCFRNRRGPPILKDGAEEALEDLVGQLRTRR
jgi:hypothetical protein